MWSALPSPSAVFWRRVHGWLTVVWFVQFPLVFAVFPTLKESVTYLIFISIAAAALGQLSSWQAARVEVKQDEYARGNS